MSNKPLALIIEDEADLSEIYSKALEGGGFETETIRDGRAALQRLAGSPPSVIVLDLHLPYVGGEAILQQIRADKNFSKTAVIITTADERTADEMRGKADLVLLKPVSVDQLRELAKRMLQRGGAS
jgi:DNA-binding response OmpR family regulator